MIPNQWYAIAEASEVQRGKVLPLRRMGMELVAWRSKTGQIALMRDLCPHRGAALSGGKVIDDCIECPFHGFQYSADGRAQFIPANGRNAPIPKAFQAQTIPFREEHGMIWAWYGNPREQYPAVPWFAELDESWDYAHVAVHWKSHYTRSIENQLDVSHLPFVHKNTIGRGNRTLVNGPYVTLEDNTLSVWVDNRHDDGTPPTKPTQMPVPYTPPMLTFKFPNVWQNRIAANFRVTAAFAPIDDENTMVYVRTYQRTKGNRRLNQLLTRLAAQTNRLILREDQRVVETQKPKIAGLDVGEKFIPGDRPIALFLLRRRDLILAAHQPDQLIDGAEAVATADAEIDWSVAEEGEIRPNLPYDLRRRA